MKRYIIGLTLASALTMGLTSCSDFLEEPIRGQQDMDQLLHHRGGVRKADYRLLQLHRTSMTGGRFTNSTTSATSPPMIAGWVTPHRTRVTIESAATVYRQHHRLG